MSPIYWSTFTWDAFATLATGLAAVAAAVAIGLRQAGIAKEQAAIAGRQAEIADSQARILGRQVALAELGLRQQLFDRRFSVYEATKNYLLAIVQHADAPDIDTKRLFHVGLNEAQFLFSKEIYDRLNQLFKDTEKFFYYKRQSSHLYETAGHYGDYPDKEFPLLNSFSENLISLGEFFGEELKLSAQHGAS